MMPVSWFIQILNMSLGAAWAAVLVYSPAWYPLLGWFIVIDLSFEISLLR